MAVEYLGNDQWVKKIEGLFDSFDLNKNGYLSTEEFKTGIDRLAQKVTDRPELIAKLREASAELTTAIGITETTKADKKKFVELLAAFVTEEKAKALIEKHNEALFDVVDRNHDGHITWEEYKSVMETRGFNEPSARAAFDFLDKDKNGKIDRKELAIADVHFWTSLAASV